MSSFGPADDEVEVRRVQPYQATKEYVCPGCNQQIGVGVGHVVAVPLDAPDLAGTGITPVGRTGTAAGRVVRSC